MSTDRRCAWCRGPIPAAARRDAKCCSVRCRQARHRFITGVGVAPDGTPGPSLRLAYADPPYPGKSARYYSDHPDYAGEVDHAELIASLSAEYDGWALSTSAHALQDVLASCPPGVRVACWHRGARLSRRDVVHNAWEPVIYAGGRPNRRSSTNDASLDTGTTRRVDVLQHGPGPRLTDPDRVVGAKPAVFCRWIFELLGAMPHDTFTDVFPGSGGVARAWEVYTSWEVLHYASCRPADTTHALTGTETGR